MYQALTSNQTGSYPDSVQSIYAVLSAPSSHQVRRLRLTGRT